MVAREPGAGLLSGIRVVEMGLWAAGPAAGGILADWGAEVIKLEPPSGDPMRRLFSALSGSQEPECPPFDTLNRGKRSITLDVNDPRGHELGQRVIASADVFLTNMRPAFLERIAFDPATLLDRHPRLIYASLTGYGLEGPDRDAPGYDVAAFSARSGVAARSTPKGEAPPTLAGGLGDNLTGVALVAGIVAALFDRERGGQGQLVSTSLLRTGMYGIGMDLATRLALGRIGSPVRRTAPQNPMLNSYAAGDGKWFWLVGAESARHWPNLVAALQEPALESDERFATPRDRRRNGEALVAILDERFARHPRDRWAERFATHEVWWAPVNSAEDVLADPQVRASGALVDVPTHDADGAPGGEAPTRPGLATPVSFGGRAVGPTGPPPRVGADTDDVLGELGVDRAQLDELRSAGVIAPDPERSA